MKEFYQATASVSFIMFTSFVATNLILAAVFLNYTLFAAKLLKSN